MDTHLILVSVLVFFSVFVTAVAAVQFFAERGKRKVRRRLREQTSAAEIPEELEARILRDTTMSSVPLMDQVLQRYPIAHRLSLLLTQADISMRLGPFLSIALGLAFLVGVIVFMLAPWGWAALIAAALAGAIPFFVVYRKKEKRRSTFEHQFPDALDLMTGALRSGMALPAALQMVAEECPDPVATEFRIVFEENRLGMSMRESLEDLSRRVDSTELRLFVTAVLIQRGTGGNLAEVLDGAAEVIRDRFRILGDVRTITAQGRFSGVILSILPILLAVFLLIVVPEYLKTLITDPVGPYLIAVAVFLQVVGFLLIRKIVRIKV